MKRTYVTKKDYDFIKVLQAHSLNQATVAKIVNRSSATLSRIYASKDFADYKRIQRQSHLHNKTKQASLLDEPSNVLDTRQLKKDIVELKQILNNVLLIVKSIQDNQVTGIKIIDEKPTHWFSRSK